MTNTFYYPSKADIAVFSGLPGPTSLRDDQLATTGIKRWADGLKSDDICNASDFQPSSRTWTGHNWLLLLSVIVEQYRPAKSASNRPTMPETQADESN